MLADEKLMFEENVLVTTQMAKHWLSRNFSSNRPLKLAKIPGFARDMAAGDWVRNGETLKFNERGELVDGQNRMTALALAGEGKPAGWGVRFDVVRGVPHERVITMDTGAPRSFGDVLKITEHPTMRNEAGAVVRWILLWDAGARLGHGTKVVPTHSELLQRYEKDPELFTAAANRGKDCSRQKLGATASFGTAYVLFHRIDPEQCQAFFDHLVSGANLPEAHPILTLRNKMIRSVGLGSVDRGNRDKLTPAERLGSCVRAWNAVRAGEPMSRIQIIKTGKLTSANFPTPL